MINVEKLSIWGICGRLWYKYVSKYVSLWATYCDSRARWLRGRALDYGLREPRIELCAADSRVKPWASLNLSGIRRKEPIFAIIYDGGVCAHVTGCLSRRSGGWNQLYGFSLDLRLVELVPVNYCFFFTTKWILKLFSVCCRYYETPGVVGC